MKNIRAYFAQTAFVKGLVIAFACSLFLVSNAQPALAVSGSSASSPAKGLPNLENVQEDTEEFMSGYNRMPGLKETEQRAAGGLNSVQGGDDADKMIQPEDAQGATTTLDNLKQGLDNLLGND